jgi:hypothetical protein
MAIALCILAFLVIVIIAKVADGKRSRQLSHKYGGSERGRLIADRKITVGMTVDQMIEAFGKPRSVKTSVLKRGVKTVYGYPGIRVTVEGGIVQGWSQR